MTHPTREAWISYLYDEVSATERMSLESHSNSCAECRAQLVQWQRGVGKLDEWKLPPHRRSLRRAGWARWAVAAAVVALAVVGGKQLSALTGEVNQLRAEIQRTATRDSESFAQASERAANSATMEAQSLVATVAQQWEQKRVLDRQTTVAALQQFSARHAKELATLRKELETVAVFSEAGWQRAQNQISTLAGTTASISNDQ